MENREFDNTESISRLEALPDALLLHTILPLLDAFDLGRLACCNSRLNRAAVMDHLWYPLLRQNPQFSGPRIEIFHKTNRGSEFAIENPPHPWQTWYQVFCFKQPRSRSGSKLLAGLFGGVMFCGHSMGMELVTNRREEILPRSY
eukprot:Gb_14755 [translate_table: standard]